MDSYEATKTVFSRIQGLDPENASKIMGYLLLQDNGDKEMIRLAFGPETLLQSLIIQAKAQLGLLSSSPLTSSVPSSPSPFNPTARPNPFSLSSSRLVSNNNGFDMTNPSSPSTKSWPELGPSATTTSSLSYASIVNGTSNNNTGSASLSSTVSLSTAFPYYNSNGTNNNNADSTDLINEHRVQEHFSFLNDSKSDDLFDPRLDSSMSPTGYGDTFLHRRSFSVPGACFGSEDANSGFGWKPCLYFARGFCKNGTTCKFLHGDLADSAGFVDPPSKLNEFEQCQELLRSKAAAQQQKLAAASQFMSDLSFPCDRSTNFLLRQQNDSPRSPAAAALMAGDEYYKFGRCRPERNDFSPIGFGGAMNPGSRQIYLTFPADSTFREEDVSNYFSIYGPVQDVRIPYQQKRMFGFVTFVYPETVRLILAKGNPHFVCDSRVLVKPYKEKGKVSEKKQHQQHIERGDYSACSSPSGLDSREPFDLHLGSRMFYNAQEMLRRKLEEQADLRQAIELHERRLMNLQLIDLKNRKNQHQYLHGLSSGSPVASPTVSRTPNTQSFVLPCNGLGQEVLQEGCNKHDAAVSQNAVANADQEQEKNLSCYIHNGHSCASKDEKTDDEESGLHESLEYSLPDNLFTSPKKSAGDHLTVFSLEVDETESSAPNTGTAMATNVSSFKSCFHQMPRFSSEDGIVGL